MKSTFEVRRVLKRFGDRQVLNVSNISFSSDHVNVLAGNNGSGKSTLLKILSGLLIADVLDVRSAGHTRTQPQLLNEAIYVHQQPYMFRGSVAQNVGFGLRGRTARGEREKAIGEALQWAGLVQRARDSARAMSGGEQMKIALARARVLRPAILTVDEPTANLDKTARNLVVQMLTEMSNFGSLVLVTSHDPDLLQMRNALLFRLNEGQINRSP